MLLERAVMSATEFSSTVILLLYYVSRLTRLNEVRFILTLFQMANDDECSSKANRML